MAAAGFAGTNENASIRQWERRGWLSRGAISGIPRGAEPTGNRTEAS